MGRPIWDAITRNPDLSDLLSRRLALLGAAANLPLLTECLHGIERECLRVDSDGKLALTPHPRALVRP